MTRGLFAWLVVSLLAVSVGGAAVRAQQRPNKNSVRDGVYSEAQAKRGEAIYTDQCVNCHGPALEGRDMAAPLAGSPFLSNWNGLTVGDLADRIRISMPADSPGKLSRQQSADVIAYILKFNRWPAGDAELPAEVPALKTIKIDADPQ